MQNGIKVDIHGPSWGDIAISDGINNNLLGKYYASAKIVLNDTLPGMKKFGFISNRIFDVSASGALVISDYMKEIEDIYGDSVPMWKSKEELIDHLLKISPSLLAQELVNNIYGVGNKNLYNCIKYLNKDNIQGVLYYILYLKMHYNQ